MLYARHFDRALVIGLGTGCSTGGVERMGYGAIDVAEIAPGIVAAARREFGDFNGHVLDAPNVNVLLEDGRNLLLLRDATYDLISVEISSIWFASGTNLYAREFYALAKKRLRPGGILQQWVQLHHAGLDEVLSVLLTVRAEFRYVSLFFFGGQGIIVASETPQVVQPGFAQRMGAAGTTPSSPDEAATTTAELVASRLLAPADFDRLPTLGDVAPNTDRNRFLEYASPRYNFRRDDLLGTNLRALASIATFPPPEVSEGVDARTREALATVSRATYEAALRLPRP